MFDLTVLDQYTQRFERAGSSLWIRTYFKGILVDEYEFLNAPTSEPTL